MTSKYFWHIFAKIGLQSFGGPAAQISVMHRVLVDEAKLLTETQFLRALSFCMLLPGPEAMQLVTYAGWRIKGIAGGIIAGLLFVVPGAVVILGLAILYVLYGNIEITQTLFTGVKAAVLAIVIEALLKVSKKALHGLRAWLLAGAAFAGIFLFALPFPLIIAASAVIGFFFWQSQISEDEPLTQQTPHIGYSFSVILIGAIIWALPIVILDAAFDLPLLTDIGIFFSKLAMVTFGGAYAVLAYMSQDVVTGLGWLTAGEMMDGLGLAETTPGPLILVTEFVGFLTAYKTYGLIGGIAAAGLTLWVTFVPCFIWIFAGAPYIERLTSLPSLNGALSAITASVVGVILNLSIWFALHVLFQDVALQKLGLISLWTPDTATLNLNVLVIFIMSCAVLFYFKWGIGRLLFLSAAAAYLFSFL